MVNGGVCLGCEVIVSGGVSIVNGSIFIDCGSQIEGGVEIVNGGIGLVESCVGKDVEIVNGDIIVGIGLQVNGGVYVCKLNFSVLLIVSCKLCVIIGLNVVVNGFLQFECEVVLYVYCFVCIGLVIGVELILFDIEIVLVD